MARDGIFEAMTMITFDTSGLTGAFAAINGTGTTEVLRMVKFLNLSNTDITLSYNGSDNQDFIRAGGDFILDLQTNSDRSGDGSYVMSKKQIVYVKGSAGVGDLLFIGYY